MRDFLLNEAVKRLAAEASTRFSVLIAGGDQIPFDVAEQPGPDSLFHSYRPLTDRYVREREAELVSLPAFEVARDAVEEADIAADYLEQRGEAVPADPGQRASKMLTTFIAALWEDCTEFSLDRERLDTALVVLDAEARDVDSADVLIAPLVGFQMPKASLALPHAVRIVRADAIEAPMAAMQSEGMGRASWEPQFLALAEQGEGQESAEAALNQLRELISVLRLFRAGGVGLGPYAFAPGGEDRWRRISTGAPGVRPGGYRLNPEDAEELAEFATTLEARPDPDGALAWAVARFEMGCARESALEGLSDHLLALRSVLDGHGPVGASLPMRAAALMADESLDKTGAYERIEQALELERSLMTGGRALDAPDLARWVEDGVRSMLRDAALGDLGSDLGAAADENLIATGLAEGDAEITVTVAPEPAEPAGETPAAPERQPQSTHKEDEMDLDQETRIMEPVPAVGEIRIVEPASDVAEDEIRSIEPVGDVDQDEIRITATNWLDEVSAASETLEWPAAGGDIANRERIDTPRVRHLFHVPEDADWEVRELEYDHYRHAG